MHNTTVSLTSADLSHNLAELMTPSSLAALETAVMNRLNAPPAGFNNQHVTAVDANIVGSGHGVKFIITAANTLDPATVKAILR